VSLGNFSELQTAIAEWLYRTGDTAYATRAPDLIALFEADFIIDPDMRTLDMEEIDTATIGTSAALALPAGYLSPIRAKVIGSAIGTPDQDLIYVTPDRAAVLDATTATDGTARYYTVLANQIFITPQKWVPTGATFEFTYYKFSGLSDSNTTNWLLQKYPNLYLYGSLLQGAAYVDDDGAVSKWKGARDEAMAKLARTLVKRKMGAGPLRMGASASFIK
jgi:hypothetical protein